MQFRSIPFQMPTAKLLTLDNKETPSKPKAQTFKQGRAHDHERASMWWEHKGKIDKDDETGKSVRKSISTRSRRRRSLLSTRNSILLLTPSMHMLSLHTPCPQKAVHRISHHLLQQWTPTKVHGSQLEVWQYTIYLTSSFLHIHEIVTRDDSLV